MDDTELERLRDKYARSAPGEVFDPRFQRMANSQIEEGGRRNAPYAGMPTLLGAPYRDSAEGVDIALIGVPMDLGVTNRTGARFGPRALRSIERVGPYHHVFHRTPMLDAVVADLGDVEFRSRFSLDMAMEDIEAHFARVVASGARTLAAGGDHSITLPIMRALGRERPLGMVHIDAHCDTSGEFDHSKFHHGAPFRQAVLDGVLDPKRCVQIGIRGSAEFLWEFSYDAGMTVLHIEDVVRMGIPAVVETARAVVGDGPVYVTFDVDGLDPAFAPGTGTPEVGGLTPREAQEILRGLDGLDIVGGDVVEVAPQYDATTNTAQVGAQIMFEILTIMTGRKPSVG
ncbi:MAG: agmatinase [Pseudomonadota bacterium]|nr:agmatinase [Pseudomonadota bacterium]